MPPTTSGGILPRQHEHTHGRDRSARAEASIGRVRARSGLRVVDASSGHRRTRPAPVRRGQPPTVVGASSGRNVADGDGTRVRRVGAERPRRVRRRRRLERLARHRRSLEPQGASGIWAAVVPRRCRRSALQVRRDRRRRGDHAAKADPMARQTEMPAGERQRRRRHRRHDWNDEEWMCARLGTGCRAPRCGSTRCTSARGGRACRLRRRSPSSSADHVASLGFTHVELLPVAEHPFGGSWGYQVTGYYAPTARFGAPDDFRAFVDMLHQRGIGVIVDWVPAHFPKDEWSLARFDGTALYEHADPRQGEHPDWGTLRLQLRPQRGRATSSSPTRCTGCDEFHIDGLRVDAVASDALPRLLARAPAAWMPERVRRP